MKTLLLFVLLPAVASVVVQSGLVADFSFALESCLNGSFADATAGGGVFGDLVRDETTTSCAEGIGVSARNNPENSG
jgi:hypothetical protein